MPLHGTEGGNIKLSSVASNVLGVSGRNMLEAMIQGERDTSILADFALKKLKAKKAQLKLALEFDFAKIIKWQTDYLYVYFLWTGIVALLFPLIFKFN